MTQKKQFDRIFNFNLTEAQYKKIIAIANNLGLSPSAAMRLMIDHANFDLKIISVGR
jgi:phage terminase small subunit